MFTFLSRLKNFFSLLGIFFYPLTACSGGFELPSDMPYSFVLDEYKFGKICGHNCLLLLGISLCKSPSDVPQADQVFKF